MKLRRQSQEASKQARSERAMLPDTLVDHFTLYQPPVKDQVTAADTVSKTMSRI